MSTIFRKTGVKIAAAILCILSLTAALVCGLAVLMMLVAGVYDTGGSLFDRLAEPVVTDSVYNIMQDYFDPNDPTHPWVSYYAGGIYTGESSNLVYTVTNTETGETVLSTYDGKADVFYTDTFRFSYEVVTETETVSPETVSPEDVYTVDSSVFICGGVYFGYDGDSFQKVDGSLAEYIDYGIRTMPDELLDEGFFYEGDYYAYDGHGFYLAEPDYETYVDTVSVDSYDITCYLLQGLPYSDIYRNLYFLTNDLEIMRYWLIGILAVTAVLGIVLLAALGGAVGRKNGRDEPYVSLMFRLPPDVAVVAGVLLGLLLLTLLEGFQMTTYLTVMLVYDAGLLLGVVALTVYVILLLCVRVKTHTLVSGSVLYRCVGLLRRLWGWLRRSVRWALDRLPLLWKVDLCYGALCVAELIGLWQFSWPDSGLYVLWFLEKLILGVLVNYVALAFLRLKRGAEAIAAGDYNAKVSQDHLVLDFRSAADTINHIRDGMNAAVDSRMKSERLKTELITNVSHDLKTPLTSIVSYVDLLKQEPVGSEAAGQYLEVLDRQSARLKKLIEDLVEVSKASTGNITVHKTALDLNMLLGQALGEYTQRLETAGLTPVLRTPEEPVMVQADGRLLWRVFDNLLGNIVKYAMPGTRVYLTVTVEDDVTAVFRNISREELNVTAEELLERFVRGDASRHTEGNGLGLSIARSLTTSMGGSFGLQLDGDLFKAMVTFPLMEKPEDRTAGEEHPET